MKKYLIAIVLVALLLAPVARAQTVDLETQYRVALMQLIDLLFKQVQALTAQLALIQAQQSKLLGEPYGAPALPAGFIETENKNFTDDGQVLPTVKLNARVSRYTWGQHGSDEGWGNTDTWVKDGTLTVSQEEITRSPIHHPATLAILIEVGNPDSNFIPSFTCHKFGVWGDGNTGSYDRWENNVPIKAGNYGVSCGASQDYIKVVVTTSTDAR